MSGSRIIFLLVFIFEICFRCWWVAFYIKIRHHSWLSLTWWPLIPSHYFYYCLFASELPYETRCCDLHSKIWNKTKNNKNTGGKQIMITGCALQDDKVRKQQRTFPAFHFIILWSPAPLQTFQYMTCLNPAPPWCTIRWHMQEHS